MIPLLRMELVRRFRRRAPVAAAGAHVALAALAWRFQPPGDPYLGDDVANTGIPLVWLVVFAFEIGRDRDLGLDALLTGPLVTPGRYVAAKGAALAILVGAYHGALLLAAGLSPTPGPSATGLLRTTGLTLPLAPLVLGVELVSTTRVPAAYVLAAALGTLLVLFGAGLRAEAIAAWLGAEDPSAGWRPALLGIVGLALLWPLAVRRVAGRPPF